jgi:hypothetical protein
MKHFLIIFLFLSFFAYGQGTITGTFPSLKNQYVKLTGFDGFKTYIIDSVKANENGIFQLTFGKNDNGMGYLAAEDNKPFIIILAGDENLNLEGETLAFPETVTITLGKQNQLFGQYAIEQPKREQALSAWDFLEKTYQVDPLFSAHKAPKNAIEAEKRRIREEDRQFLVNLDPDTYVGWYLPVRKLVSSVSTIAQYRTEEIPVAIAAFRDLDYADQRLFKSGLLRESIEAYFWLIENSGKPLDSVFLEMNISIDRMIEKLMTDEKKLNEITDYLFGLLERHSLFASSEYLALKVLNEVSCTIDNKLANQLESYRAMQKGNVAPDIVFSGDIFINGVPGSISDRLYEINSVYKLIIFGAGWCPKCTEELSQIPLLYSRWKSAGVEVIFISLDTEVAGFKNFVKTFPFISICDYKKWETHSVKDYHVFATPTMFLLDNRHKILLRPNSVKQLDAWIDMSRN